MILPTDQPDIESYNRLFNENQKLDGFGLEVTMYMPCPFCCADDFMIFRILEQKEVTRKPHVCRNCNRGAMIVYTESMGGTSFEIVQTAGEDPPDYLPQMRRVG
jgi:hypothetical protein